MCNQGGGDIDKWRVGSSGKARFKGQSLSPPLTATESSRTAHAASCRGCSVTFLTLSLLVSLLSDLGE